MFFTYPTNHLIQFKGRNERKVNYLFFLQAFFFRFQYIPIFINFYLYISIVADIHLNINIPTIHRKYYGNIPQPGMMSDVDVGEISSARLRFLSMSE